LINYLKAPTNLSEKFCETGKCKVNLFNGSKICPGSDSGNLSYDEGYEVCSEKYSCPPEVPYSLNPDGSSNNSGRCQGNFPCPCSRQLQCPYYIASAFRFLSGTARSLSGTPGSQGRIIIDQITPYSSSSSSGASVNGNNIVLNGNLEFCSISSLLIAFSNPGCSNIDASKFSVSAQDIIDCLNLENGNPCLSGNLVVLSSDPISIDKSDISTTNIACVTTKSTCENSLPVFDLLSEQIVCI
jgi:hypothetical protein